MMSWYQKEISLPPRPRGFHLITAEIVREVPEIRQYAAGLAHIFIKHTSASLAVNESYDPDVRLDMESHFNHLVPENAPYFLHTYEGPDDMPAHIKAALLGSSVTVPITQGRLNMGAWQGIYLCEHRGGGRQRQLVVTVTGQRLGRP
jgi:secondary thiamine-phosphate synthase enzyme